MHVALLILGVVFFCITFNHLFIEDYPHGRGINGFLMAGSIQGIIIHASALLLS